MSHSPPVIHFRESGGWCPFIARHPDSPAITDSITDVTCKKCKKSFQAASKRATHPFRLDEELIYASATPDSEKVKWKVISVHSVKGETNVRAPNGLITTITRENIRCWRQCSPGDTP
jgi:hypothetical protein